MDKTVPSKRVQILSRDYFYFFAFCLLPQVLGQRSLNCKLTVKDNPSFEEEVVLTTKEAEKRDPGNEVGGLTVI